MDQINFDGQTLILYVKPSPIITRILLFVISVFTMLVPVIGAISYIVMEGTFHIIFAFAILFMGYLGFYLFRLGLWNTHGLEVLKIQEEKLTYWSDYKWFKGGTKTFRYKALIFTGDMVGFEDDNLGVLVADCGEQKVKCAVKLPMQELSDLVEKLNAKFNSNQNLTE